MLCHQWSLFITETNKKTKLFTHRRPSFLSIIINFCNEANWKACLIRRLCKCRFRSGDTSDTSNIRPPLIDVWSLAGGQISQKRRESQRIQQQTASYCLTIIYLNPSRFVLVLPLICFSLLFYCRSEIVGGMMLHLQFNFTLRSCCYSFAFKWNSLTPYLLACYHIAV